MFWLFLSTVLHLKSSLAYICYSFWTKLAMLLNNFKDVYIIYLANKNTHLPIFERTIVFFSSADSTAELILTANAICHYQCKFEHGTLFICWCSFPGGFGFSSSFFGSESSERR